MDRIDYELVLLIVAGASLVALVLVSMLSLAVMRALKKVIQIKDQGLFHKEQEVRYSVGEIKRLNNRVEELEGRNEVTQKHNSHLSKTLISLQANPISFLRIDAELAGKNYIAHTTEEGTITHFTNFTNKKDAKFEIPADKFTLAIPELE